MKKKGNESGARHKCGHFKSCGQTASPSSGSTPKGIEFWIWILALDLTFGFEIWNEV